MIEIIELEDGTKFEYSPNREEIIVYEREHDKCYTFSAEKFEEVVNRMREMGWVDPGSEPEKHVPEHGHTTPQGPTGRQILHG